VSQNDREPRPPAEPLARSRSWLARLFRRAERAPEPTIVEIMAQWAEYELIFNDLLTRLSAMLARQAKMEKKRLERLSEAEPTPKAPEVQQFLDGKAALRRRYAHVLTNPNGGQSSVFGDQSEPASGAE